MDNLENRGKHREPFFKSTNEVAGFMVGGIALVFIALLVEQVGAFCFLMGVLVLLLVLVLYWLCGW